MKLITMVAFVLQQTQAIPQNGVNYLICRRYANLLNQLLTLGMFVPCDEEGNVLEEPEYYSNWKHPLIWPCGDTEKNQEYQQAKERVLFESIDEIDMNIIKHSISLRCNINDLSEVGIKATLTQTAIKQLGL